MSLGRSGQRAGDPDPLPLAAGELVRVPVVVLGVEANQFQQVLDGPLGALLGLDVLQLERRADDGTHRVPGIQRRVRVLEDHLHLAPQRAHGARPQVRDVAAVEYDLPGRRLDESHQHPRGRGLAAARLAHDAQCLAADHVERDIVHAADQPDAAAEDDAPVDRKVFGQPGHRHQRIGRGGDAGRPWLALRCGHASSLDLTAGESLVLTSSAQISRCSSADRWQATSWPSATERSGGTSCSLFPLVRAA